MPFVLKASEALNKCAIYYVASLAAPVTTGPLTSPDAYVAVVHFHSDWLYPNVIGADHSGTASIPAVSSNSFQNDVVTLFAHGQSDAPMVFGDLTVGSKVLTLAGDIPVARTGSGSSALETITWVSLEVDSTYVYLRCYGAGRAGKGASALSVGYNIKVTNCLTTGGVPSGSSSEPLFKYRSAGNYLTMGRGKIDSRLRYIKKSGSGSGFQVVRGQTLQMISRVTSNNGIQGGYWAIWGYSLDSYKVTNSYDTAFVTINPTYTRAYA
jgi:hypothetical protein